MSNAWGMPKRKKETQRALNEAIRAEAGWHVGNVDCVVDGKFTQRWSPLGEVICVTCGDRKLWSADKKAGSAFDGCDAGHFCGTSNAVRFIEIGINPQCIPCNQHKSANLAAYELYMVGRHGQEKVDTLRRLKRYGVRPWTREDLDTLRAEYRKRTRIAKKHMALGEPYRLELAATT